MLVCSHLGPPRSLGHALKHMLGLILPASHMASRAVCLTVCHSSVALLEAPCRQTEAGQESPGSPKSVFPTKSYLCDSLSCQISTLWLLFSLRAGSFHRPGAFLALLFFSKPCIFCTKCTDTAVGYQRSVKGRRKQSYSSYFTFLERARGVITVTVTYYSLVASTLYL